LIKELLPGQDIPAEDFYNYMPGIIDFYPLFRRKEKSNYRVGNKED
jgi:hypothetical protein